MLPPYFCFPELLYYTSRTGIKKETTLVRPTIAVHAVWRVKWILNEYSSCLRSQRQTCLVPSTCVCVAKDGITGKARRPRTEPGTCEVFM